MERVTFKIAKSIKEAGYPQSSDLWYSKEGKEFSYTEDYSECYARPYIFEVWEWLWKEKKSCIGILFDDGDCAVEIWQNKSFIRDLESKFGPEEAIKQSIEYLVTNDLIK